MAHSPTASPPPDSTVMSRASISVSRRISTPELSEAAPAAAVSPSSNTGGFTSSWRRWSVQSPPRTTSIGAAGNGMIEPTDSPLPLNSNDVT